MADMVAVATSSDPATGTGSDPSGSTEPVGRKLTKGDLANARKAGRAVVPIAPEVAAKLLRTNITLSTFDAARVLGVSYDTLRRQYKRGLCDDLKPSTYGRAVRWPSVRIAERVGLLNEVLS